MIDKSNWFKSNILTIPFWVFSFAAFVTLTMFIYRFRNQKLSDNPNDRSNMENK